jgi:hypothetical protein
MLVYVQVFPADLNVVGIGDIVSYQWYKGNPPTGTAVANSANISGAQSPNLHFNQASLADDGSYYVVISGRHHAHRLLPR